MLWHPDKNRGKPTEKEATAKFQRITAAYKKLTEVCTNGMIQSIATGTDSHCTRMQGGSDDEGEANDTGDSEMNAGRMKALVKIPKIFLYSCG